MGEDGATLTKRADFMQFASPTKNNDVGDCQKTYKVRSHYTLYSPSIKDEFEVQTSFTSQKDRKKSKQSHT